MIIKTVEFKGSFAFLKDCPKNDNVEYAFIGRSNVGKSSLINYLVGHSTMAKVSSTPGKTQVINYFSVNESWFLVDLPGYGYARVSKKKRNLFKNMIRNYLNGSDMLACAFVLIDANVTPQKGDIEFINQLGTDGVPFAIVYTKIDKSKPGRVERNIEAFQAALLEEWDGLPQQFKTSSEKKIGGEEILDFIEQINQQVEETA